MNACTHTILDKAHDDAYSKCIVAVTCRHGHPSFGVASTPACQPVGHGLNFASRQVKASSLILTTAHLECWMVYKI